MENSITIMDNQTIQNKISTIRDMQVMIDRDLPELYTTETKKINKAVKNNQDKFPNDFFFELTNDKFNIFQSKISTVKFAKLKLFQKFLRSKVPICS